MPSRKPFLLRIDPALLDAVQRWAADDLRSLNGQIEYLLRRALIEGKRWKPGDATPPLAGGETAGDGSKADDERSSSSSSSS